MALSDPTNVRVGLARKQELLQRLAQQMAAKGPGAGMVRALGGRAQGTGANFASAVNLRTGGPARVSLPFALPVNRMRPAGFDPDQSSNAWGTPQDLAPVLNLGPAGTAGGTPVDSSSSLPTGADLQAQYPDTPGVGSLDPAAQYLNMGNDLPLNQPAPDPYTVMATAQLRRIMGGATSN